MAAAVEQRREPDLGIAAADVQGADPFGAVDFVSGKAQQIDRAGLDVDGTLPTAWAASVWKTMPRSWQSRPISAIGLSVPTSLLAAMTETRTVRSVRAAAIDRRINPSMRVAGNDRDVPAFACQPLQGVEDRLVLGGGRDEVVAAAG